MPNCPLCGARSTWVRFSDHVHDHRPDLRERFPDECHFCKREDKMHWKNWEQGIDITQFGGEPMTEGAEPHPIMRGVKVV